MSLFAYVLTGLDDFGANFSSSLPVTHHLFWIQGPLYIHIPLFHIYSRLMLWVILNLFGENPCQLVGLD